MIKQNTKEIAKERIDILISNALREVNNDDKLSNSQAKYCKKNCDAFTLETSILYSSVVFVKNANNLFLQEGMQVQNRTIKYKGSKNYLLKMWSCIS